MTQWATMKGSLYVLAMLFCGWLVSIVGFVGDGGVLCNINILLAIFKWNRFGKAIRRKTNLNLDKSSGPKSSATPGGLPESLRSPTPRCLTTESTFSATTRSNYTIIQCLPPLRQTLLLLGHARRY